MFVVFLSTQTPQYVLSYEVCSYPRYTKLYKTNVNAMFLPQTYFQGKALTNFIQNSQRYYLDRGKLIFNTQIK